MSSIGQLQRKFSLMVSQLIAFAYSEGYEVSLGEAWRSPEQSALNAKKGIGISNSLHTRRLAIDLILFKDGKLLSKTEDHAPLGKYWKSIGGSWGGDFSKPDGGHYSLSPDAGKTR